MLNVDARNRKRREIAEMCTFMVLDLVLWKLLIVRCPEIILQLSWPVFSNCCGFFYLASKKQFMALAKKFFSRKKKKMTLKQMYPCFDNGIFITL